MTLSEFKAWFAGFSEAIDGAPNKKQWECVKQRMSEIDDNPVVIDRSWQAYPPVYTQPQPFIPQPYVSPTLPGVPCMAPNISNSNILEDGHQVYSGGQIVDSLTAMGNLGWHDAHLSK